MPTLEWIGKDKVINHHAQVPFRMLEKKYTYNAEESENMIIRGDNLEALKALLPRYEGKIKCIYIDPPYNTGNEGWVYNDNVNDPHIKKWLGEVVGKEGEDLSRHDKWLCMMYPRLKLLHKLLSEDGAIFISIDDSELVYLSCICDEIFGTRNYVDRIVDRITVIVKTEGRRYGNFAKTHENILVYAKQLDLFLANEIEVEGKEYQYKDECGGFNLKGLRNRNVRAFNSANRPNLRYPFYVDVRNPDNNGLWKVNTSPKSGWEEVWAQTVDGLESVWRWGKEKSTLQASDLCAYRGKDGQIRIFQKERKLTETAKTVWIDKKFTSIFGTKEIQQILGKSVFDFPKSISLIQQIMNIATNKNAIILDSFAGSGTTAHAVLNLNKSDGGNRRFILVEMNDYAESITAERVKRVIDGYGEGKNTAEGTGGDFSFYDLGEPLLIDGIYLNANVGTEKIREYVWFTETGKPVPEITSANEYYLGENNSCSYYFYYEKNSVTTLNDTFLATVDIKSDEYVIYADKCVLSDEYLAAKNITFKKIPRDISKI
ncbi:MAG: site-specific DNA-methyltransferase [Lachnospiraceae bacterium]|nr:site-specific DNA-methyltransferase [Ruminococcus sp.]MCM1276756.1 site-specific DNA-methyltransferase [Lachnospiraceae bacterium]